MNFYVGLHQPSDAQHFDRVFVSINRLKSRKSNFAVRDWILDSGAFTQIAKNGCYTTSVKDYAKQIARWSRCGNLVAACAQDYMCEPFMFEHQGTFQEALAVQGTKKDSSSAMRLRDHLEYVLSENGGQPWWEMYDVPVEDLWDPITVRHHQEWTIDRYANLHYELRRLGCRTYLMPVLQGYEESEYLDCLQDYENAGFLPPGAYVGVGSICKRNSNAETVEDVLAAILSKRPDLQLHGFGLKMTALENPAVVRSLTSSDSMAWSFAARYEGRNGNDWREAKAYEHKIKKLIEAINNDTSNLIPIQHEESQP